jgi:secreted PhoX family phosphatase
VNGVRTLASSGRAARDPFAGGEGVLYRNGVVYLSTKGDGRIWALRLADGTIGELYDPADVTSPVLNGVDNIQMHPTRGILYVAEDGDDMQVVGVTPDRLLFAFCQATGPQHGVASDSPIPTASEITGIAFNPRGDRLYLSSQRGFGLGITYEIRGPF